MVWQAFLTRTKELEEMFHQSSSSMTRSQRMERIEDLLEQRQALLSKLPQPSTDEEKAIVQEVKKRDLVINQKMEFLLMDLKNQMRNNKKQKSSKQRYINPYQSVSTYDGMYLDHKK
ncbi:flagellar protein FliT [Halobacillus litoralis]|uniref:flagellar protein FliT n=1 Tax=Halobacillus litoralis TaxID=45668 RepID=UPI001CD66749|nr:flagellar protein FliT [Halobacillus litoralis]MCA1021264.1 flagellar protein FliT [Halobacillus litoralis]